MWSDVTCIILAGGVSRRMGQDKAFIQIEGVRLLDYVYGKCQELFKEIIIVTNQPQQFIEYQTPVVVDEIPRTGSLIGLYTGLKRASNDYSFCVACDMPFLKPELIAYLIDKRHQHDVVIPKTKAGLEPLHALYSKRCIGPMEKLIKRGDLKISNVLTECRVYYCREEKIRKIDPALTSFVNANTKRELFKIQQMLKGVQWAEKREAC
jgi:molybdopterin-guanine dinucleotide biosynthesis protein A